jgi:hypothetical protein
LVEARNSRFFDHAVPREDAVVVGVDLDLFERVRNVVLAQSKLTDSLGLLL